MTVSAEDRDARLIVDAPMLSSDARAHGYFEVADTLDALMRRGVSEKIGMSALSGHVAFLEEVLEAVLAGFERAVDRLKELGDDESSSWIMTVMGEHGIHSLLNRKAVA